MQVLNNINSVTYFWQEKESLVYYEISNSDFTVKREKVIQGEDYDNFYSSWCVAQDGKIIVAKFDVESKHSVVEKSG